MKTIPIHERFYSFQGEGVHMGRSAFFVRSFGCPVHCPWCDSAGTWHPDHIPKDINRMTAQQLISEAAEHIPSFICLTGGEPLIHDWSELLDTASRFPIPVHVETSGAFDNYGDFNWVTLSPKKWRMPTENMIQLADEFKIIVESPEDIEFYLSAIGKLYEGQAIWLHPEWSKRNSPEVKKAIIEAVKGDNRLRAGWQLHKLYQADSLDSRTQPLAPLGGDLNRGF